MTLDSVVDEWRKDVGKNLCYKCTAEEGEELKSMLRFEVEKEAVNISFSCSVEQNLALIKYRDRLLGGADKK